MRMIRVFVLLVFTSCSKEKVYDPSPVALLYPTNNNICLDSDKNLTLFSNINFVWKISENTDSYELVVQNQINSEQTNYNTSFSNFQVSLKKGTPYSWWVNALSKSSLVIEKSQVWSFYLEGESQLSYLPFPAEIISPKNKSKVKLSSNRLSLNWKGSDLDNDILKYSLKIGLSELELYTIHEDIIDSSIQLSLKVNTLYYWQIITIDKQGNNSFSQIYSFTTEL